jgi:hypothetical protein
MSDMPKVMKSDGCDVVWGSDPNYGELGQDWLPYIRIPDDIPPDDAVVVSGDDLRILRSHRDSLLACHEKIAHMAASGTLTDNAARVLATETLDQQKQWHDDHRDARIAALEAELAEAKAVIEEAASPLGTNDTYRLRVFPKARAYMKERATRQAAEAAREGR